ncbi:MAG TPA: hypothetical protein VEU08_02470, partial [Vicinamibacterales bacterium]|nr:hypothetical protein [Vicinamibacterales bacterium]
KMPYINGAGFLFRLREDPSTRNIPVAVITGVSNISSSVRAELTTLGARVWHKPLSLAEIGEVARTLLSGASHTA